MIRQREFHPVGRLKTSVRPYLLPFLQRFGWRRPTSHIPFLTAKDRLRRIEVPSQVSVRDDQTILVNGTPFFPNGLYYAEDELTDESGAGLLRLRRMGFNTIFFNGGLQSEKVLDRIWNAGLHVWYRPPGELYREFELLKEVVSKFARHPAVLFWEIDDEPILNQLEFADVEIGCQIVRGIDPYHPILCNQWLSNLDKADEMKKWAQLADAYGFGVYPVPLWRWGNRMSLVDNGWPHSIAVVGKQMDLWKSYAPNKPIIPVLQAWASNCLEDGEDGYPTYDQCRFMVYQLVIHGAKGFHHYGATESTRPNFACGLPPQLHSDLDQTHADFLEAQRYNEWFWNFYSRVIDEISEMSGVFTARDADWRPEIYDTPPRGFGNENIECRVKQHGDSSVILMINASESHVPFEFLAPAFDTQKLKVWGESRSIGTTSERLFKDVLEPFGIRIYSDQPDLLTRFSDQYSAGEL